MLLVLYQSAVDQLPASHGRQWDYSQEEMQDPLSGQQSKQIKATGADEHSKQKVPSLTMAKDKTQLAKQASDNKIIEKEGSPHQHHLCTSQQSQASSKPSSAQISGSTRLRHYSIKTDR